MKLIRHGVIVDIKDKVGLVCVRIGSDVEWIASKDYKSIGEKVVLHWISVGYSGCWSIAGERNE